jgi:hypothetical protein
MSTQKSVLVIGLVPELVDFSAMPEMNAEKVRAGIISQVASIAERGYRAQHIFIDLGETAESVLKAKLAEQRFDCVVIGAGVRLPVHHLLFEKVINIVHEGAPQAKIGFNTTPGDTLAAVQRWT